MKTLIFLVLLSFSGLVSAQNTDIELKTTNNQWVNLQDELAEKVTILDFWATWFKPWVNH